MPLEIEFRAKLSEGKFAAVEQLLTQVAEDLGPDDKHIWFYVLPDKLLKVVHDQSHGRGRIVVKSSKIGHGSVFPETEVRIPAEDVAAAVEIFEQLGFSDTMHQASNKRHNYRYRGVEIAMKWSDVWSHHAEFEVLLPDGASDQAIGAAKSTIHSAAAELGVTLMTDAELAALVSAFEAHRGTSGAGTPH
jgi:adenylate cyclase class IV